MPLSSTRLLQGEPLVAGPNRQDRPLPVVSPGRTPARLEPVPAAQVVAAAGTAVVSAARMGRLLTRSGWGLARRLPGGQALQREVQRLQDVALHEVRRILDVPDGSSSGASRDEQRVMLLVRDGDATDPLRSAMNELLERSVEPDRTASREYLFGNIISQLVPDEARIVAALSDGTHYAAGDVVARQLGRGHRVVVANVSTVGRSSGVVTPDNVPTYVSRLRNLGLVDLLPEEESLAVQYDILATDSTVQSAEAMIEARRLGSPRLVRKTLAISPLGREFWAAADPSRSEPAPPRT